MCYDILAFNLFSYYFMADFFEQYLYFLLFSMDDELCFAPFFDHKKEWNIAMKFLQTV